MFNTYNAGDTNLKIIDKNKMEKFIVYRKYYAGLYWTYERIELTKAELKYYLFKHQTELENIEVFKEIGKVKIDLNVSIDII